MRNFLPLSLLVFSLPVIAQQTPQQGSIPPAATITLSDTSHADFEPAIVNIQEQPKPASDLQNKKAMLHQQRMQNKNKVKKNDVRGAKPDAPLLLSGFNGNSAQGTPNDNHLAVSNSGWIVSVVNTNVRVFDTLGVLKSNKSLTVFAQPLGSFSQNSDPRVLYDPTADRFIVVFFSGSLSTTNKIIVAFSKTGDPTGAWNLYQLPGNYLNDTTWSDYPIISISNSDLFMTFNQLKDGQSWQTGFRYSIIWQIDKNKGYNGDTLSFNYWSNIQFNGKPLWSVCPVMEAVNFTNTATYFLSVRPGDLNNDSVFLHTITNTQASGTATLSTQLLKTNVAYGVAPNGIQPSGQQLATNDTRVLHAIIHNNRIYYAQNCITPYFTAGIYLGRIDNPSSAPTISGQIIGYDTLDLGYPALANIGNGPNDHRSALVCGYVSDKLFSGTAAFYIDNNGDVSDPLFVKKGEGNVNVLVDSVERWGDYSAIQRVYNEPFTAWLAHSYGRTNQVHGTWIAKIATTDSSAITSVKNISASSFARIFPNPVSATDRLSVQFESQKSGFTLIQLTDVSGRVLHRFYEDYLKAGVNEFSFNPQLLSAGVYFLQIIENGVLIKAERVVRQ